MGQEAAGSRPTGPWQCPKQGLKIGFKNSHAARFQVLNSHAVSEFEQDSIDVNSKRKINSMCGIVGAISKGPIDPQWIKEMRDCLAHRGPDHAGLWSAKDGRVCLGHRRLAIVDLKPEANQPFVSS